MAAVAAILLLLTGVFVPPVAQAQFQAPIARQDVVSAPPAVVGVRSRKTHGVAGAFDLLLASTPVNPTIEPRSGGANGSHVVVLVFDKVVTGGTASITEGNATLGAPTFNGTEMAIPLSGVANAQYVTVVVNNVTASDGGIGGGWVRLGFLIGNTSGSQTGLPLLDWPALTAAIAQPVTTQNFQLDLNTDGSLTLLDKLVMLGSMSQFLPPPDIPTPVPGPVVASGSAFANFVSSPFNLAGTFTSNSGPVTSCDYSADGGATWAPAVVSGGVPSFTCSKTGITGSDGQVLNLTMRATNASGTSTAAAIARTVDAAAPTNGSLAASPGNSQILVSWSGVSELGSGLSASAPYKLVFSAGTFPASCNTGTVLMSGTATSFTHAGLTNGTAYYYRVCAADAVGNVSVGATASAIPQQAGNQPPVANAGPDQVATVNSNVSLDGYRSVDPDGTITNYSWNFGDGITLGSSASGVSHVYRTAGIYTATLTVTDNLGARASDTAVITITSGTPGAYRWATRAGGTGGSTAVGYSTAVDSAGNVIVAGAFWGAVDFGGGVLASSGGSSDIFVAKYSPAGAHIWSKRLGGTSDDFANSVAVDSSGNVLVVGSFKGTVNFGGGPLTALYSGFGPDVSDFFVVKLASDGTHLWSNRFGGYGEDNAYSVAVDHSNNVLVAGSFVSNVNFGGTTLTSWGGSADIFLAKYASTGQLVWAQKFGSNGPDIGYGVAIDANNNVFLAGSFTGPVDFGGGALPGAGSSDIVLAKYTAAGAYAWARQIGGAGADTGYGVATDVSGNVVVTGYVQGTVDFGGGPTTSLGSLDSFVAKYSTLGAHLWSRRFGSTYADEGLAVATDPSGNVVIVGAFQGVANFGAGALTSAGSWDIFAAKLSSSGVTMWSRGFGGTGDDLGYGVGIDASGNVTVTGTFQGTVNFGGGPVSSLGWSDLFILNLAP